jgi:pyridoxine kinase
MNFVYSKGEEPKIVMADRIGGDRSGTGDVISAVIAGMYLNGHDFYESVKKAAEFASKCIEYCEQNNVPDHWGLSVEMYLRDLMED